MNYQRHLEWRWRIRATTPHQRISVLQHTQDYNNDG